MIIKDIVNKAKAIKEYVPTIALIALLFIFMMEVKFEKERQVEILINHLEGLEMELDFSSGSIVQIRDKVEFGTLTAKPITISLYKILESGNMGNETIRRKSISVLFALNEILNTLDYVNSLPEEERTNLNKQIKNIIIDNKIKESIEELKILSISYKECLIQKEDFNKC